MSDAAKRIIEALEALLPAERQEDLREFLRSVAVADYGFTSGEELVVAGDDVFLELDRRENRE